MDKPTILITSHLCKFIKKFKIKFQEWSALIVELLPVRILSYFC